MIPNTTSLYEGRKCGEGVSVQLIFEQETEAGAKGYIDQDSTNTSSSADRSA